jgi:hypothetical protein
LIQVLWLGADAFGFYTVRQGDPLPRAHLRS